MLLRCTRRGDDGRGWGNASDEVEQRGNTAARGRVKSSKEGALRRTANQRGWTMDCQQAFVDE